MNVPFPLFVSFGVIDLYYGVYLSGPGVFLTSASSVLFDNVNVPLNKLVALSLAKLFERPGLYLSGPGVFLIYANGDLFDKVNVPFSIPVTAVFKLSYVLNGL